MEIKKLQLEIDRLELPEEISEKTKSHANTLMEVEIERFTVEIVREYHSKGKDGGRDNELRNAVKICLNKIANKIDHGFNFEVRIEPAELEGSKENEELGQAVETIQAASGNMQY